MNLLHVVDLGNRQAEVGWRRDNEIPRHYSPIPFEDPLSARDRAELRWYLEDYLQFPYGAEEDHARRVENKMAEWGESLFAQVFPKAEADPDPRGFYQEAVRAGLEQCELCVSSEDTEFLNIPWELIRDPTPGRGYLAPLLAGMYRQRSGMAIQAPLELSEDEPFRILLVIARPYGEQDVPLGTVARPMLEALGPLRPRVELDVLRPPTFEALVKQLEDRPGFYHLVHFDGHGVFASSASGPLLLFGAKPDSGHLVFENLDGTPHIVNSEDLGQALATCKVPLFVLNACQSAEEGKADPYSSVAAQLVAIGAKGVVAMSYSVYAVAAALFVERFYEKLVGGSSLCGAVAAGRKRLHARPGRVSVVGTLDLRDWMVPTLYQQEQGYVPIPEAHVLPVSEEGVEEAVEAKQAEEVCRAGPFGFIGRDYDILRIERALRDDSSPWALLSGMGGIGKTELAFGFARWYAETGGCPGGVFMTSFKEKADFGQVIGSIVGYGTDFSRLSDEEQWEYLVGRLREKPSLLIWDNFETVAGYPEGVEPLATEDDRGTLSRFLKALSGGASRVLITSRKTDEGWLGIAPELIELGGLTQRDAGLLAREILKTVGRRPQDFRDDPRYAALIRLLSGHPRSLEVVLPHLRTRTPDELIGAIRHRVDDLAESIEDASLSYAFHELSEKAQRHLPFLGLFVSHVEADALGLLVAAGDGQKQAYVQLMGEVMDGEAWEEVLEEGARSGLLRCVSPRIYELHPTLPPFLRRQLVLKVGEQGLKRLDSELVKFYATLAATFTPNLEQGHGIALAWVSLEEGNLLRALRLAEMNEEWAAAQDILQALAELYDVKGRKGEWAALVAHMLRRVGREIPPASERGRGYLRAYLLSSEALLAIDTNDLATAECHYRDILQFLDSVEGPRGRPQSAMVYHQLGIIAQERHQLDEAERWYRKALEAFEAPGLERHLAGVHHQLGIIAQTRHDLDDAERRYRKALDIFERLGLDRDAAGTCFHLGTVARARHQLDEADRWYRNAFEMYRRQGMERGVALCYRALGNIAAAQRRYAQAEDSYRNALAIHECLAAQREIPADYHLLGVLAETQGWIDQAEQWYRRALDRYEELGLDEGVADEYHHLGTVAVERGDLEHAERCHLKALGIYQALRLDLRVGYEHHELGVVAQLRHDHAEAQAYYNQSLSAFRALGDRSLLVNTYAQLGRLHAEQQQLEQAVSWFGEALQIATEYEMPVKERILTDLGLVMEANGEDQFRHAWHAAFGEKEPPLPLIGDALTKHPRGTP